MRETIIPDATVMAGYLSAFKNHLRLTGDDMDSDLTQILDAAFKSAEHVIGRVIPVSQVTVEGKYTSVDSIVLRLRGPVIALDSVIVGADDVTDSCTLDGNCVTVPGSFENQEVTVTYTAGWESIPADALNAVFLIGSSLFSQPLDSVETLPKASSILLRPYRTWGEE
jgi:hypothetical protein